MDEEKLKLRPMRLQRAEQVISRHFLLAEPGITAADVLDVDYLGHVGDKLRRSVNGGLYDEIRVVAKDGSFDIEVTVVQVDSRGNWVRVEPIRMKPAGLWDTLAAGGDAPDMAPGVPDPDGWRIELSGPHRWRVINATGDIMAHGLPNQAAAEAALAAKKAEMRGTRKVA